MIELPKKTEAQKLLDRFIDSEENPENAIRLVFVPEELYSDLKDKGISPVDLLYYDKAVRVCRLTRFKRINCSKCFV